MPYRNGRYFASSEYPKPPESDPKRKLKRWGTAFLISGLLHSGLIFHEQIEEAAESALRSYRSWERSSAAKKRAEQLQAHIGEELQAEEPIDIDLSTFYFADELLNGGVNRSETREATRAYNKIVNESLEMLDAGEMPEEVVGYILKNQGEYDSGSAHLTDLMIHDAGNCEARTKFISSAMQDVFPSLVEDGQIQYEVFGSYVDEQGESHPGHVRVIIDQGYQEIAVLEGEAMHWEPRADHESIPRYEATSLAVKSALADAGMYSYEEDDGVVQEVAETGAWTSVESNSTLAFPRSAAHYEGGGTQDVELEQVHGSWALAKGEWKPDFILLEPPRALTVEDIETMELVSGYDQADLDISSFPPIDDIEIWEAIKTRMIGEGSRAIHINPEQHIPPEIFKHLAIHVRMGRAPEEETLKGQALASLMIDFSQSGYDESFRPIIHTLGGADLSFPGRLIINTDARVIGLMPDNFEHIYRLDVYTGRQAIRDAEGKVGLLMIDPASVEISDLEVRNTQISIQREKGPLTVETVGFSYSNNQDYTSFFDELGNVDAEKYTFSFSRAPFPAGILHDGQGQIPSTVGKDIAIRATSLPANSLSGLEFESVAIGVTESIPTNALTGATIEWLSIDAPNVEMNGAADMKIGTLVLGADQFDPQAFKGAEIDHLVVPRENWYTASLIENAQRVDHVYLYEPRDEYFPPSARDVMLYMRKEPRRAIGINITQLR